MTVENVPFAGRTVAGYMTLGEIALAQMSAACRALEAGELEAAAALLADAAKVARTASEGAAQVGARLDAEARGARP